MKKSLAFIACFVILASSAFSSPQEGYYSHSYARLSYIKGDVFVQRGEDLGYEEGVVNLPLVEGDKLGTQEGRAEVHFGRKNYLRINRFTQVDFVDLPQRGDDRIKIHLLSGEIFLRINFLEIEKGFEVHSPDASFYILEEGLYRFDVRANKETELSVFEGAVEAAGEEGSVLVEGRERLIATNGYFQSDPVYFHVGYDDSFASWNGSRDALHCRALARRYLPEELHEYEVELAYNGRWVYERPYGYVWVPSVYHYEWRPYFYGRWVWYPIIGWNWVSYEPWGWCVYHYGRWHWRVGLGWYWIPTRFWGPAWVHWCWGYDYVGWCPLSYYGYPVVIINNRFHGRYYDRYYPVHSRALTVVHKNQLQARRISKVALSQSRVARLSKISLSSKQPSFKPALNKSRILNSRAAKTLSRAHIRPVKKGYLSGKTSSSFSRLKSTKARTSPRLSTRSSSPSKIESRSMKKTNKSTFDSKVRIYKESSDLSAKKWRNPGKDSSRFRQEPLSRQSAKTYPSKQRNSSSTTRSVSISSSKSRLQSSVSRERPSYRSSSYPENQYRPSEKRYSPRISKSLTKSYSSRGSTRQIPNLMKNTDRGSSSKGLRSQSFTRSPSMSFRSQKYRSYTSPSGNYLKNRSSSRGISLSRSKFSSSRSYSSPRISSPNSRSSFKSSSSRPTVSSSRSSSGRIKKR